MLHENLPEQRKDRTDILRRALPVIAPLALLAACDETGGSAATSGLKFTPVDPPRPGAPTLPVPQFYAGSDQAPRFTEIGFSLHCGASRDWFRNSYQPLWRSIKTGQQSAMFSHVVRTEAELDAGIAVMSVGPQAYPGAMVAVIALTLSENRSLSAREIRSFLPAAGYPRDAAANDDHARAALMAVRVLYESINVNATPYVNEVRRT
ncbi:MAG: hypothetical protein II336_17525 [Loktanella sp.]|nr:hypothetical protein [Loktanella sp.]